ncbi:MAG: enoyl-CoA hydratase/isomerase family protein [Desulfomonile sp.]|nr:enoyl-CoA hydratase/isomerase family protein [Desulfomonile sp.]
MPYVSFEMDEDVAWITLNRGKVNALNNELQSELDDCLRKLESDPAVRAVVLTGTGKFFTFGLDIPELFPYSKEEFTEFLTRFTDLYAYLFLYPKPVVAALNGHTIAGGCMIATACDYRIMVSGKAKISLNEITFGSSVFAGSVEMLRTCVGNRNAHAILYSGAMLTAEEALDLGLIDQKTTEGNLREDANKVAQDFASRDPRAFASIKRLLRKPIANEWKLREQASIDEFVDIWYSESTRAQLEQIKIYS